MQQEPNPQVQQTVNPLFLQNPIIQDKDLLEICPFLPYPPPPAHYKQKQFEPPKLSIIKQYSEGLSSFGCIQGIRISPWSQYGERKFKAYDQNIKSQLKNLNNSIYSKMRVVLDLLKESSKPQQLKQLTSDIEKHMIQFYNLTKTMKEYQIRKNLFQRCQSQTKKYEQMNSKYNLIYEDSLSKLYRYANNPLLFNMIDQ